MKVYVKIILFTLMCFMHGVSYGMEAEDSAAIYRETFNACVGDLEPILAFGSLILKRELLALGTLFYTMPFLPGHKYFVTVADVYGLLEDLPDDEQVIQVRSNLSRKLFNYLETLDEGGLNQISQAYPEFFELKHKLSTDFLLNFLEKEDQDINIIGEPISYHYDARGLNETSCVEEWEKMGDDSGIMQPLVQDKKESNPLQRAYAEVLYRCNGDDHQLLMLAQEFTQPSAKFNFPALATYFLLDQCQDDERVNVVKSKLAYKLSMYINSFDQEKLQSLKRYMDVDGLKDCLLKSIDPFDKVIDKYIMQESVDDTFKDFGPIRMGNDSDIIQLSAQDFAGLKAIDEHIMQESVDDVFKDFDPMFSSKKRTIDRVVLPCVYDKKESDPFQRACAEILCRCNGDDHQLLMLAQEFTQPSAKFNFPALATYFLLDQLCQDDERVDAVKSKFAFKLYMDINSFDQEKLQSLKHYMDVEGLKGSLFESISPLDKAILEVEQYAGDKDALLSLACVKLAEKVNLFSGLATYFLINTLPKDNDEKVSKIEHHLAAKLSMDIEKLNEVQLSQLGYYADVSQLKKMFASSMSYYAYSTREGLRAKMRGKTKDQVLLENVDGILLKLVTELA